LPKLLVYLLRGITDMATINGGLGNDNLIGTSARDTLNGFSGNDTLIALCN
jgi:Ca2+-binding RTX toxin-like protein